MSTGLFSRGIYGITYANGVYQEKHLITHEDFELFKMMEELYNDLLIAKDYINSDKIKKMIDKYMPEHWFTDKSPIWEAFDTGILSMPKHQGGDQKCTVIKL